MSVKYYHFDSAAPYGVAKTGLSKFVPIIDNRLLLTPHKIENVNDDISFDNGALVARVQKVIKPSDQSVSEASIHIYEITI
jgi:hypothetical protein